MQTDKVRRVPGIPVFLAVFTALSVFWAATLSAQTPVASDISRLINVGQVAEARALLEAQNPSQADLLFFDGRVLKASGRFDAAIATFREVLRLDPNYINARRELAHTLLLNRDFRSAEYHFNELLRIDRNGAMRDGYRRFLNIIQENEPVGVNAFFALLPSTNINRGTDNATFDTALGRFVIDPDSQRDSGIGVLFGVSGYFRHLINPTNRVALNWSLQAQGYEEDSYNSATGELALAYTRLTPNGEWRLAPFLRRVWREDDADYDAIGLRFGATHRLSPATRLGLLLGHEERRYDTQTSQDGARQTGLISLSRQLSPSMALRGALSFQHVRPEAAHLQYDERAVSVGLSNIWEGGLQTSIGLEYGRRDYVGVFPLTTTPREDEFARLRLGVQNNRFVYRGFTPLLSCTHTINTSNVSFFDYQATECQATIARRF